MSALLPLCPPPLSGGCGTLPWAGPDAPLGAASEPRLISQSILARGPQCAGAPRLREGTGCWAGEGETSRDGETRTESPHKGSWLCPEEQVGWWARGLPLSRGPDLWWLICGTQMLLLSQLLVVCGRGQQVAEFSLDFRVFFAPFQVELIYDLLAG